MFAIQKVGPKGTRYAAAMDGYHIQAEVEDKPSVCGIARGRIVRLLIYPTNSSNVKGRVVVYDGGWKDGLPVMTELRKIVEKAVYYFDKQTVDWLQEGTSSIQKQTGIKILSMI